MKYSLIAAILVAFALSACGEPKPGQYPPGLMDEREGMDELDAALVERAAEQEKTVMDTIEEAVEEAIEAVEEAFDDDEAKDDDADADDEAEDDDDDKLKNN